MAGVMACLHNAWLASGTTVGGGGGGGGGRCCGSRLLVKVVVMVMVKGVNRGVLAGRRNDNVVEGGFGGTAWGMPCDGWR